VTQEQQAKDTKKNKKKKEGKGELDGDRKSRARKYEKACSCFDMAAYLHQPSRSIIKTKRPQEKT